MKLEILQVPDCPNVVLLEERIAQAVAGEQIDMTITHRVLVDPAAAIDASMTGSPTLLVDGEDPFADPGLVPSVSCRLYRADGGGIDGAPSVSSLRAALHLDPAEFSTDLAHAPVACCAPTSGDGSPVEALGAWRGAAQPEGPAEKAIHHAILQAFAARGGPPPIGELDAVTTQFNSTAEQILDRLHESDVIRLDEAGAIASAYPFSVPPTPHRVQIEGRAEVYAMCAIDALGISTMLGDIDVVIDSVDPSTGDPISVKVRGEDTTADPVTTVVFVGAQSVQGPSADTCCNYLNFFTDHPTAEAWAQAHPHVGGIVVELADATRCGAAIFGSLLAT